MEFLETGGIIRQPIAYFLTVTKIQEIILKRIRQELFDDLHKDPNFDLQKKNVLAPFLTADDFIIHRFIISLLQTLKSLAYSGEKENKFKKHQEDKQTFFNADRDCRSR